MKLFEQKLKSGYILSVYRYEKGPMAARLDTNKKEFVGQIFSSLDTLVSNVEKISNYEIKIGADDLKKIKDKLIEIENKEKKEDSEEKHESIVGSYLSVLDKINMDLRQYCVDEN